MKTSKPIAGIGYNSIPYLKQKLNEMIEAKVIGHYAFIHHEPEANELKEHLHVYIEPYKPINTVDFEKMTEEPDKDSDKPLKCLGMSPSNATSWILYTSHNEDYAKAKGYVNGRKYTYDYTQYHTDDENWFQIQWINAFDSPEFAKASATCRLLQGKTTAIEEIRTGQISWQSSNALKCFTSLIAEDLQRQKEEEVYTKVKEDLEKHVLSELQAKGVDIGTVEAERAVHAYLVEETRRRLAIEHIARGSMQPKYTDEDAAREMKEFGKLLEEQKKFLEYEDKRIKDRNTKNRDKKKN